MPREPLAKTVEMERNGQKSGSAQLIPKSRSELEKEAAMAYSSYWAQSRIWQRERFYGIRGGEKSMEIFEAGRVGRRRKELVMHPCAKEMWGVRKRLFGSELLCPEIGA